MEVMEEGNLLDRVRILLQRDLDYYGKHQTVLQETLCSGVVGGLLDFPRYASFAAVKLVTWWEEQFLGAYRKPSGLIGSARSFDQCGDVERGCGGIVATSAPADFLKITKDTAGQLLEHLHVLSQEALDHADLTVLTATLGAAALVKNCLWCYNDQVSKDKDEWNLHDSYKMFQEMSEALAERLLDLHCRLLSLYVLQDADSLSWEQPQPFFEGERGSFVVEMWWLYMQGTRQDLWATVPPRTAQRVLSGMLNETLTILACRYNQAKPSPARIQLLITDICNILMCVNELLPSISSDASELLGIGGSKAIRDIHAKCHQLLTCLILRGTSLSTLFKVFRHGLDGVPAFDEMGEALAPWMLFVTNELPNGSAEGFSDLPDNVIIFLELKVLVAQPQPSYPLLLKVLCIHEYKVALLLLKKMVEELATEEKSRAPKNETEANCTGFLCSGGGDCNVEIDSAYGGVEALVSVMTQVCSVDEISKFIIPMLELTGPDWALCLDRHQVWNLRRPSWLAAILNFLEQPLRPLANTLIKAAAAGVTVTELVGLTLTGLVRLSDILPLHVFRMAYVLQEFIPADVKPLGKSVLTQFLVSVIYALLIKTQRDEGSALAEALCHVRVPSAIVTQLEDIAELYLEHELATFDTDITVSHILSTHNGRHALKAAYQCVVMNEYWLLNTVLPGTVRSKPPNTLLHTMFHIGSKQFDQILSGEWKPDYQAVLERPMSLSRETAWLHLSRRPEFTAGDGNHNQSHSKHDRAVVETMKELFSN